jgi:hypothetical protein
MNSWSDIWGSEWYRIQSPQVWEEELMRDVKGCTVEEIARGVRDMKFDPRTKDRPTLKDLRIRLYVNRKKDRGDEDTGDECALCNDGWLTTWRVDDTLVSLPCACSRGSHWRESLTEPNERQAMLNHAKRSIKRNSARERALLERCMKLIDEDWTVDKLMAGSPVTQMDRTTACLDTSEDGL